MIERAQGRASSNVPARPRPTMGRPSGNIPFNGSKWTGMPCRPCPSDDATSRGNIPFIGANWLSDHMRTPFLCVSYRQTVTALGISVIAERSSLKR